MGRVQNKVAFITGAARGQGRSHAVRLAEEGADIIAVDMCSDVASIKYSLATPEDLQETVRLVEAHDRRIVAIQADVREPAQLREALARGVAELGRLDVVVAQAGIAGLHGEPAAQVWADVVDTNLTGTINAVHAALAYLTEGASIIATGSTAAMMITRPSELAGHDAGGWAYNFAKQALSQFIHELATTLADQMIRANVIHPTNCATPMLLNDTMYRTFRRDLENPTHEDALETFPRQQAMPIPYVDPIDISNAVLFLASDESRYVTGMQLRIDGGGYLKWHEYHA